MSYPPVFFIGKLQKPSPIFSISVHTILMRRNFPEVVYFWPFRLAVSEGRLFKKIFSRVPEKNPVFCPHRVSEKNSSIFCKFTSRRLFFLHVGYMGIKIFFEKSQQVADFFST